MSHLDELDEFEADARAPAEEGVRGRLRPLPLLRAHAGRDVSLQQARPSVRAAGELSVLPPADGGRLGLGQEPPDADHPARRGLHLERRHGGGAPRRGRRARRSRPRRSPSASARRSPRTTTGYVESGRALAVDVGNTQTVFGLFDGDRLAEHWRVATESTPHRPTSSACSSRGLLDLDAVDGVCLSSTVPPLVRAYEALRGALAGRRCSSRPRGQHRHRDPLRRPARGRARPDRQRGRGEGALRRAGIVVDFGTSTNFDVVSPEGEYVGGVLAPGIEISMDALFAARRAPVPRRLHAAAVRDREDDVRGAPVGARLRLRRAGRRDRRRASAASSASRRGRSPPAGSPS